MNFDALHLAQSTSSRIMHFKLKPYPWKLFTERYTHFHVPSAFL